MLLTTLTHQLRIARNEANEDAALLDLTSEGDYAQMPAILGATGVGVIDIVGERHESTIEVPVNGIEFYFCGGNLDGRKFGYRILAWKTANGPARAVAWSGGDTCFLGTQKVVKYPHNGNTATNKYWSDHLVVGNYNWPKRVRATDVGIFNSVGSIWFDACGYRFFKVEITNADGVTGTEAGNMAVYWSFW